MPHRNGQRKPAQQVVVVTGGSAGVGRATARAFAERGARLGLIARGTERLEQARRELERLGARAAVFAADVADHDALEAAAEHFERELGPIDVWVNNAMATIFSPLHEISPEEYRRSTEVTYLGSVWGTIVQVGSALAYRGIPLQAPYCGAKHALEGFLDSLRTELMHEGSNVQVTVVELPTLNTPQFSWGRTRIPRQPQPVPPIFQPEVAARAIVWAAAHPQRRELYVGWPTVKTIWGNKLAAWYADRYLAKNGYQAQLEERRIDPGRPDNLFEPAPGDFAAHGIFDDRAKAHSPELWAATHRRLLGVGAGLAAAGAAVAALVRR